MENLKVKVTESGAVFRVKVVPGSSRTALAGVLGDLLKVKVAAPPEKGKANKCLVEFLARQLGVKKNQISIVAGQMNPAKTVQVSGITAETVIALVQKSTRA